MAALWWWLNDDEDNRESVDSLAGRLSAVADDLEDATTELRSLVSGLRAVRELPPKGRGEGA